MISAVSVIAWVSGSATGSPGSPGRIGACPRRSPDAITVRLAALEISASPTTTRNRSALSSRVAPLPKSTATTRARKRFTDARSRSGRRRPAGPAGSRPPADDRAEHEQEDPDVEGHRGDQLQAAQVDDLGPGPGACCSGAAPASTGRTRPPARSAARRPRRARPGGPAAPAAPPPARKPGTAAARPAPRSPRRRTRRPRRRSPDQHGDRDHEHRGEQQPGHRPGQLGVTTASPGAARWPPRASRPAPR